MSHKLLKSTAIVSLMTLMSRVLGFARDVVIAHYFGVTGKTDAFFVALRIPNLLRRLFGEGAFAQAFVPVMVEYKTRRGDAALRELLDRTSGTLAGVLTVISVLGVLGAPVLVMVFAPGFMSDPGKALLAGDMLRITFPYALFISLTAFAGSVLNAHERFWVPALTPVFLNLSLIGCAVLLAPHLAEPIHALAWGVFIAGVVQLGFQFPFLRQLRLFPRPRWGAAHEGVRRIMRLMLPALFGSSVAQVNILFDTLVASFLLTGSVSWLFYADRLLEFPLALLGIALGTVILPSLSRRHAEKNTEEFNRTLDWAMRWMVLVGVPSAVGLLMLAAPILVTLFRYGEFAANDARMAAAALTAYSVGLMGFLLVKVLAPAYYSRQDTRTPVRVGVVAMVSNMVLDVVFTVPLVKLGFWAPHAGLAAATAVSAFVNSGLLLRGLRRQGVYRPLPGWSRLLFRVTVANVAMGAAIWMLNDKLAVWLSWGVFNRFSHLLLLIAVAAVVYFSVLWLLGVRPSFLVRRLAPDADR